MYIKKSDNPIPISDFQYKKDKRTNIPTHELRDFVADMEKKPKTLLYPRDTSLDPQLVWKGKDEQDAQPLEVPAVPIYIQEKILPKAIIEEVRAQARGERRDEQLSLFADFNGIESFEEMVDFYRHEQNWSNRLILGDSLLVMTSLAEKEGLKGQVQMIYIDPPYGIKFGSNWQVSTRKREVKDGKIEDLTREPEQIRAYRDTWRLGIHSYLSYLRDRLVVARELLTDTGSIFVQIGDENLHLVRCLLDEVFGSGNFVSIITFRKMGGLIKRFLPSPCDYILWYAKSLDSAKSRYLFISKISHGTAEHYTSIESVYGQRRPLSQNDKKNLKYVQEYSKIFQTTSLGAVNPPYPFDFEGKTFIQNWNTNLSGLQRLAKSYRIIKVGKTLRYVRYLDDFPFVSLTDLWDDTMGAPGMIYAVQTNTKVVERCLLMTTDPGDLVLDPTCGSGTTAYVAEKWGRRWITIDTSRVALALARTRLMAAKYPYFLLADSPEGIKKEAELTGLMPPEYKTEGDIKKGFVYKRVPHITLKSIANNEEIDEIYARRHPEVERALAELNAALRGHPQPFRVTTGGRSGSEVDFTAPEEAMVTLPSGESAPAYALLEWEVPFDWPEDWPEKARQPFETFHQARRQLRQEIDESIARRADTELLYDQPYEDPKRIRVTGPFTVESLSPHRVLAPEVELPESEARAQREAALGQFETMILENLKKAGVQNTKKNERLKFDRLEPYAGEWLHAEGEYTEKDGTVRRVAVCIGPEHGTVGPELVKEAAKEAVKGVGFDLLIVCGFAFDPHVSEEAKRYGKLTVLPCRMNPDLSMGDELLKKTGAGNLFMVFGEPDIALKKVKNGKVKMELRGDDFLSAEKLAQWRATQGDVVVEIYGLDVYDPTTGQIRSNSTDDLACWFIDTNYNGESFFVRHAYFTGADRPYDKLKRALRAEIDEAAWSALYSTVSRPFPPPATGKIAVKVINHYGDEVLKVFEV
ncbi:MAG: site-specific DNA-methyltransferase [Deltaproteobacteria bacterium]|nr:site-specific DNA-methyltransferase [Deltaproteobacteria bacterium]